MEEQEKTVNSMWNMFAVIFVIAGIVLGIWFAIAYGSVDSTYLAQSVKYPSAYPISEAPRTFNFLLGITVFGVFSFFGLVCSALQEIIYYVADSAAAHK